MKTSRNQSGIAHPLIFVVIVIAFVVAAGLFVQNRQNDKPLSSQDGTSELIDELPGNLLTIDKIQTLAEAEKPGSKISAIKLEKDGEVLVYIVRLTDGSKLIYNAQSGVKVTGAGKIELEDDDDKAVNFESAISFQKAYEIALAQNPGGKLKEAELDNDDGQTVYKFEFSSGAEITISADDGSVVKSEKDDEDGKTERKHSNRGSGKDKEDGDRDNDGTKNNEDSDDDNDGQKDSRDNDDDNDGTEDSEDKDDDEDGVDDDEDDGEDDDSDNSGSGGGDETDD
jgi:uncharacterized membrane protein YkoI